MPQPDLSVILISFNSENWLRRCLGSIAAARSAAAIEIILVDNGSRDGSIQAARDVWPGVIVLAQSTNLGYVKANNIGLAKATGRYVMFLNNDTEIEPACFDELVRFMDAHPEAGLTGPKLLNPDGSDQGTARRFPTIINGIFGRRSLVTRYFPNNRWSKKYMVGRHATGDEPFEVDIQSAACIVLPTGLAVELGGMDEQFTLYWVDAEMCKRVKARGFKVFSVPRARLYHFEGEGGSNRKLRLRYRSTYLFHRDSYLAYIKIYDLGPYNPRRIFAGLALTLRCLMLMIVQTLRPSSATSSVRHNKRKLAMHS